MKVIIIGGGPCGIMAAIETKKNNPNWEVILLEKDSRSIGSRIKVSGNGRCNLGNSNIAPSRYNNPSFVNDILSLKDDLDVVGYTDTKEKDMLRNTIIAVVHKIYLELCFEVIGEKQ